ncbi:MAG: hypothetical protein ABIF77_10885, partial [bacterium]
PGERMYLSGKPLHVLAMQLLDRLTARLSSLLATGRQDGPVPVAFSAGIDKGNLPAAVGLGLAPVTICSDLLRPGGYGRLSVMLKQLAAVMREAGCGSLTAWRRRQELAAEAAGQRDSVAAYAAALREPAGQKRYRVDAGPPQRRSTADTLQLWDCCACNICVTACPNDAMLRLAVPTSAQLNLEQKWQFVNLAELCNACGNCTTFCPEEGEPFLRKPRLFFRPQRFAVEETPGFLVRPATTIGPAIAGITWTRFAVQPHPTLTDEAARLTALLNSDTGLPLDPADLPPG